MTRELDAQVAEEVMGYVLYRWADYPTREPEIIIPSTEVARGRRTIPHYSTRIKDADLVLEKLHDEGYDITIQNCHKPDWCVIIYHEAWSDNTDLAEGKGQRPEAICLAALEAVRSER